MNALGLYTGFSSNHWHRDIQATKSTRQLTEIYSWLDASLGAGQEREHFLVNIRAKMAQICS